MRVQIDFFKNETCLKLLKTNLFFEAKYPLFALKNVAGLGPNLPHNNVTLLDIIPESCVLVTLKRFKTLIRIQQRYSFISKMSSNLSMAQAKKNKQRRQVSRRESYQTVNPD